MKATLSLCVILLGVADAAGAQQRVHSVYGVQSLVFPNPDFALSAGKVAIDGDFARSLIRSFPIRSPPFRSVWSDCGGLRDRVRRSLGLFAE